MVIAGSTSNLICVDVLHGRSDVCASYAAQVNRADVIGIPEWKGAPIEQQM